MIRIALTVVLALACAAPATAQQYPDRPLSIVSGYPAGGMAMNLRVLDVDYRPGDKLRADLWREYRNHTEILKRIGMIK